MRSGDAFLYEPAAGFEGIVTFEYDVADNGTPAKTSARATVTLRVLGYLGSVIDGHVRDASGHSLGGVAVTLRGTDYFDNDVETTTYTDGSGYFMFDSIVDEHGAAIPLTPGDGWEVWAAQPAAVGDARDVVVSQAVQLPVSSDSYVNATAPQMTGTDQDSDTFTVSIGRVGGASVELAFIEDPVDPGIGSGTGGTASTVGDGLVFSVGPDFSVGFFTVYNGWSSVSGATLAVETSGGSLTGYAQLTVNWAGDGVQTARLSMFANQFALIGRSADGGYLFKVTLSQQQFETLASQQAGVAGEGEGTAASRLVEQLAAARSLAPASAYAQAADDLFSGDGWLEP